MEELKLLIEMVANLPALAVWVLAGYLAYKVAIVGSIYGVIRLAITKLYEWKTAKVETQIRLGVNTINEDVAEAIKLQLTRLFGNGYIQYSDVAKLRQAIDIVLKGKE